MDVILTEIDRALNAGFYYLAVANCLALPDICAAMESADGETTGNRYKAWYDKWMAAAYPEITSVDMYSLRCGVIHQGVMTHRKMQYERIVFGIPDAKSIYVHRMVTLYGGLQVLMIDANRFCRDVMASVSNWQVAMQNDANVKTNMPRLFQLRPNGLPPHIVGYPVIA